MVRNEPRTNNHLNRSKAQTDRPAYNNSRQETPYGRNNYNKSNMRQGNQGNTRINRIQISQNHGNSSNSRPRINQYRSKNPRNGQYEYNRQYRPNNHIQSRIGGIPQVHNSDDEGSTFRNTLTPGPSRLNPHAPDYSQPGPSSRPDPVIIGDPRTKN